MDELIALVTPASPTLARVLAGPSATLAISLLGRALLEDEEATVEAIVAALKGGGDDLKLKIARAEADLKNRVDTVELTRLAYQNAGDARHALVELETRAANDRASARQRQQLTNDRTNAYLAYIVTVGFLLTILLVAQADYKGEANPVLHTLLGILGTGWASVIAFYFGSSVGSREKTALLGEANTPPKTIGVTSGSAADGGQ